MNLGNYKIAKQVLEKSLEIHKKQLGEKHIYSAYIKYDLARVYIKLNQFDQAEKLYEQSLLMCGKHYGQSHAEYAQILCDFGFSFFLQKNFIKAEQLLSQALKILEEKKHDEIYRCYEYLGDLYAKKNQKNKANMYYGKALNYLKKHFPKDSTHIKRLTTKFSLMQQCLISIKELTAKVVRECSSKLGLEGESNFRLNCDPYRRPSCAVHNK